METRKSKRLIDKENLEPLKMNNGTIKPKSTSWYSNNRKPLGDLDANIKVPTKRDQQTQLTRIKRQPIAEETEVQINTFKLNEDVHPVNISNNIQAPKVRSKSQSAAIMDDKITITERKNITARRRLSSTSSVNVDLSKVFGNDCVAFNPSKVSLPIKRKANQLSPIRPNVYTSSSTLLLQGIPDETKRPAKNLTLIRKLQSLHRHDQHFSLDLYNPEYLEDIICHQLKNNSKHVMEQNFLKHQNDDENNRATIVNWLIQVVDYLEQPIYVLFTSIRLLDVILGSTCIPKNMYQLTALVVMWIISKLDDNVNAISMSTLLLLSNRAYTNRQFLKLEKKLLKFLNYELIMPDVTIFVMFYLKNLNFEKEQEMLNCVHYVLECYSLSSEFSTIIYSKQAAAAVCLTLTVLCSNNVWFKLKNLIAYHSIEELEETMHKMLEQIHMIQDPTHMHRQPYIKYSKPEKLQASIIFLRKLVAT